MQYQFQEKGYTAVDNFKRERENKEAKSWEELKSVIQETSDRVLGKHTFEPRKPWISHEIGKKHLVKQGL